MGRIAVHEFIALDGSSRTGVDLPVRLRPADGGDPRRDHRRVDGILLGRRTFEMFAPAWSTRTAADDPGAPFFNDTHKYVVGSQTPRSSGAPRPCSGPSTPTDPPAQGRHRGRHLRVRQRHPGPGLLRAGLVDALHLFVFPLAVGAGERLWDDGVDPTRLALAGHDVYDNGVVHLAYAPAD